MSISDKFLRQNFFRLALVGMSNVGKSYRAKVLSKGLGIGVVHVDEKIQKALGLKSMGDMSLWMGYPGSFGYTDREKRYLDLEGKFTRAASEAPGSLILDTTGSVVHLPEEVLRDLRKKFLVVHLLVSEKSIKEMVRKFFLKPKPVAWGKFFKRRAGESEKEALRRSYPNLLRERNQMYKKLAHLTVPAEDVYGKSAEETLDLVGKYLGRRRG